MKKMTRLSLVAALAVAGFTTANAKPLTEAIQDVDVSGTVVYRYNDYNNANDKETEKDGSDNNYKIGLNVSSKVNDDVKLNTRFIIGNSTTNGLVGLDTKDSGDANPNVALSQVYFSYTGVKNTTVNVGKQGLVTPWTVAIDADGDEQTGTGISALYTWKPAGDSKLGPVTFVGGWFNQTNLEESFKDENAGVTEYTLNGSSDLYTVGVMGSYGPITADAWYANLDEDGLNEDPVNNIDRFGYGFSTYTIGAKAEFKVAKVGIGLSARYTNLTLENEGEDDIDNATYDFRADAKYSIFDAKVAYVATDKDGGLTALEDSAKTTYEGWNITTNDARAAELFMVGVGVQALEPLHIALNWTTLEYTSELGVQPSYKIEEDEIYTQITYDMSKNLSTYVRFGQYELKEDGETIVDGDYLGRLQVQYSF